LVASLSVGEARTRLQGLLIDKRKARFRRGDLNVLVPTRPRPTEGHPFPCDVCQKPVYAGDEILSPWGDWIHLGFCYMRAVMCRELRGVKPPGYIVIPEP
jgi:hypothetical protein